MDWGDVTQAVAIGLPATILGYLAYRRSRRVDAVAEQSGAVTETRAGTEQIIQGLNDLIDNLQTDNKTFRDDIRYLTLRLDTIAAERDRLKKEVARLRRKYGDNGEDQTGELFPTAPDRPPPHP